MAYPPGGSVVTQIEVQRERRFAGSQARSIPLVYVGQHVQADQPVIRLATNAGADQAVEAVEAAEAAAPVAPVVVPSGLRGEVIETTSRGGVVIKTRAALLTGSLGAGLQTAGVLSMWQPVHTRPLPLPPGAILVIPGPVSFALLRQAAASGVVGIVASSVELRDLEGFLGLDIFDLLNCIDVDKAQSRLPSMTLLFTEGCGALPMPDATIKLLSRYQGSIALISGVTSLRYALRPELVISPPDEEARLNWHPQPLDDDLRPGFPVRVCCGTHVGVTGVIEHYFVHQQTFLSGVQGQAVRLRLADGTSLIVPIMNCDVRPLA